MNFELNEVELAVAQAMGDDDAYEFDIGDEGCSRAPTMERERSNYLEAEPMGLKYNQLFSQ